MKKLVYLFLGFLFYSGFLGAEALSPSEMKGLGLNVRVSAGLGAIDVTIEISPERFKDCLGRSYFTIAIWSESDEMIYKEVVNVSERIKRFSVDPNSYKLFLYQILLDGLEGVDDSYSADDCRRYRQELSWFNLSGKKQEKGRP